jgi:hypothetical protein
VKGTVAHTIFSGGRTNWLKHGKNGTGSRSLVLVLPAALFSATVRSACSKLWPGQSRMAPAEAEQLRRHFDDDAIIELTGLIAFQNLSSKFNAALGVEPQGFCTLPPPRKD